MTRRTLLTVACFMALALTTALIAARVAEPDLSRLLAATAFVATVAGGVGALRRRAWPLALLLLPLGFYLLARLEVRLPEGASGLHAQAAFYAGRLSTGAEAYVRQRFPLDAATADLRLLLSLVVYATIGGAAFLALSLRRPLPAIAVLLCLAGFGFTTDEAAREVLPAIAFVVLAGGLLALTRPLPRERVRVADAVVGGVTATVAVLLALSILGVTTVAAEQPLRDWRTWGVVEPSSATLGFDWMQNYPKLLAKQNDGVVMEVRSPVASYWQANVLDEFTGSQWLSSLDAAPLQPQVSGGARTYEVPPAEIAARGRTVRERFSVQNTFTDHLFAGGRPLEIDTSLPLRLGASDAGAVAVHPAFGPKGSYSVTAFVPDFKPADLVGRGHAYPDAVAATYLQLPFPSLAAVTGPGADQRWRALVAATPDGAQWAGLYDLNERIVGSETDPYRIALAIQQFLRAHYTYTLQPPQTGYSSPYAGFLFQTHAGYCQHFAGAMALLLRFNGIPARVALGFTQGQEIRDGVYVVRRRDAHAWVEAYFPGVGWAPFDPTPGHELPGASGGGAGAGAAASPGATGATGKATLPDVRNRPVTDPGGAAAATSGTGRSASLWPWALIAVVLAAAWPAGRALLRRRRLVGASLDDRIRVSVSLLYALLRDHGMDVPASQTLDETARMLHEGYGVDDEGVLGRVQAILFGGRAPAAQDVADLRRLRRRLATVLRARTGRLRSAAAAYGLGRSPRRGPGTPRTAASRSF